MVVVESIEVGVVVGFLTTGAGGLVFPNQDVSVLAAGPVSFEAGTLVAGLKVEARGFAVDDEDFAATEEEEEGLVAEDEAGCRDDEDPFVEGSTFRFLLLADGEREKRT